MEPSQLQTRTLARHRDSELCLLQMSTDPRDWDEDYLLSLPQEDSTFERKGSHMLDVTLPNTNEGKVRAELAKQLSAFANSGGGRIIYGLTDQGAIDQRGVARTVKGNQSTKEWLEDLIPTATDPEIIGANVYEVAGSRRGSRINSGKAVFVVDVPDSDRAPHQSKGDFLYYVRVGGKSQPAPHRLIEDIRNRVKYPKVTVLHPTMVGLSIPRENLPIVRGNIRININLLLKNTGRVMASNVCVELVPRPHPFSIAVFQPDVVKPYAVHLKDSEAGQLVTRLFFELLHPVYPEMETGLLVRLGINAELKTLDPDGSSAWFLPGTKMAPDDLYLAWRVFADSAPPATGQVKMCDLGFLQKAREAVVRDSKWAIIQRHYFPAE